MVYRRGVVKGFAISQIFILILSLFSFMFLIAESSRVSGQWGAAFYGSRIKSDSVDIPNAPSSLKNTAGQQGGAKTSTLTEASKVDYTPPPKSINNPDGGATGGPGGGTQTPEGFTGGPFGTSGWFGHLALGIQTALLVVGAIQLIGNLAGWDESLTNTLSIAAGAGIMVTAGIHAIGPTGANWGWYSADSWLATTKGPLTGAGWVGIAVAVIVFAIMYKKESKEIYNFQCLPYEAPVGGKDCEACNKDSFRPCSEYRCRALGQACELVNVGSSDEKCIWVNPNDVLSPTITPWDTPLTENHRYTNHDTRPSSLGTKIVKNGATNGCLQAFTPLSFGITTNEPAQCKMDLEHKNTFDEMQYFFGNTNLYLYNHTQQFSLPSPNSLNAEVPELQADGKYDFFVRCRDKNGNENVDEFAIQLCVDPSPDTTAPVIVDTSIPSESYVKFGVQSVPVQFYVNEPATCKWSSQDKSYDVMENSMTCATSLTQVNARSLYSCNTNFTGIIDRKINNFFVRCKDQPSKSEEDRNVNVVSYKYNLIGSQPLNIISVSPDGTVTGNTNTVPVNLKVITDDGASEGIAICAFSPTGLPNSFIPMFETRAVEHTQRLDLTTGNYNYKIRCSDFGGNSAEAEISFSVFVDINAPLVTRAYRDSSNNALKIVTNEDASCTYSLNSCNFNFDEGIKLLYISTSNKKSHYAKWEPNLVYYIKCRDVFDNELGPNTCSFVASAVNLK